jgi:hypothetical protein
MSVGEVVHVVVSWRGLIAVLAIASRIALGDLLPHGRVAHHSKRMR